MKELKRILSLCKLADPLSIFILIRIRNCIVDPLLDLSSGDGAEFVQVKLQCDDRLRWDV